VLPRHLHGPGLTIRFASPGTVDTFLRDNRDRYSNLDPDFILQICFEHSAVRVERSLGWVYDNVRYDHNEELDFWYEQFDRFRRTARAGYEIFDRMLQSGTWPFPPVIIEAQFAVSLGGPEDIGKPYHLIEGTHRVSYARRMIEIGLAERARTVEVIELVAG
jgi:hypothetical protein